MRVCGLGFQSTGPIHGLAVALVEQDLGRRSRLLLFTWATLGLLGPSRPSEALASGAMYSGVPQSVYVRVPRNARPFSELSRHSTLAYAS